MVGTQHLADVDREVEDLGVAPFRRPTTAALGRDGLEEGRGGLLVALLAVFPGQGPDTEDPVFSRRERAVAQPRGHQGGAVPRPRPERGLAGAPGPISAGRSAPP